MKNRLAALPVVALLLCSAWPALAGETLWLEAEHFSGIRGYCWPMGRPEMKKTDGCFGLSGPGWAAEWNQGGERGFLSIATGAAVGDYAEADATLLNPAGQAKPQQGITPTDYRENRQVTIRARADHVGERSLVDERCAASRRQHGFTRSARRRRAHH